MDPTLFFVSWLYRTGDSLVLWAGFPQGRAAVLVGLSSRICMLCKPIACSHYNCHDIFCWPYFPHNFSLTLNSLTLSISVNHNIVLSLMVTLTDLWTYCWHLPHNFEKLFTNKFKTKGHEKDGELRISFVVPPATPMDQKNGCSCTGWCASCFPAASHHADSEGEKNAAAQQTDEVPMCSSHREVTW